MMRQLYWGDPEDALALKEADDAAYEKKCPICDYCGNRITDETYLEVMVGLKLKRYHEDCIEINRQHTSDYIRSREEM